jgi:hypothetical protein
MMSSCSGGIARNGRLERLLPDWSVPSGSVYWVTPPGGHRPKRLEVLGEFLAGSLTSPDSVAGTSSDGA